MKQQNVKIMKRLVVLLILSTLLMGSGLAAAFFGYQYVSDLLDDPSNPAAALSVASGAWMGFLVTDIVFFFVMLCAGVLLVFHMLISAILEVISILQIRQDAPGKQRKGIHLALAALILNLITAGVLLMLDLLVIVFGLIPFYPWGIFSVSLCLAGGTVLIFGILTYAKLQVPPKGQCNQGQMTI